jgi:hypothetical protein
MRWPSGRHIHSCESISLKTYLFIYFTSMNHYTWYRTSQMLYNTWLI